MHELCPPKELLDTENGMMFVTSFRDYNPEVITGDVYDVDDNQSSYERERKRVVPVSNEPTAFT